MYLASTFKKLCQQTRFLTIANIDFGYSKSIMQNAPFSGFNLKNYLNNIRPTVKCIDSKSTSYEFSVLSYNILAQYLLEKNSFLYDWSDLRVLSWEYRKRILLDEIKKFNADIICFQEVQESHLNWFFKNLLDLGYNGVYKQRTRNHGDGCAIYYKNDKFLLKEKVTVEYNQPGISVLDRDNVGIVLRLSPRQNEQENVIVSTTHILYNKKRHDVKLAQVHILLAEIERVSYKGFNNVGGRIIPIYHPIILTGDFNLEPNTAVYNFLINGALNYSELQKPTLWPQTHNSGRLEMGNELIPQRLGITENSQHAHILDLRTSNNHERQTNDSLYSKLYHSERKNDQQWSSNSKYDHCTGNLYHNLKFASVYSDRSCSTYHDKWIIVDYIFYTHKSLKLKSYTKLPFEDECLRLPPMPNKVSPSDHLPLFAVFACPMN
ncbi:protein angel homolog 2 isoform X2 [Daktulosphaira vitifoliae]|uniref:protein angel homolog 2 isoform X2 n=1 Tax=Daktulosphaira vitifoliae TaxID=58002 RepID=UPI0021A97A3D|nr:protein angel homolog 2 isoform X2 [Daktulosphaira vitifoliae]